MKFSDFTISEKKNFSFSHQGKNISYSIERQKWDDGSEYLWLSCPSARYEMGWQDEKMLQKEIDRLPMFVEIFGGDFPKNTSRHHTITANTGKIFQFTLKNMGYNADYEEEIIKISCRGVKWAQECEATEIASFYSTLEDIIEAHEKALADKNRDIYTRLGLRLTTQDKKIIEENSKKYGFSSVSEFLKTLGKNPEKFVTVK